MTRDETTNTITSPNHINTRPGLSAARESFSGRLLTNSQFEEAIAITGIIHREIQTSGSFKEKLGGYAHAFARSERFDAVKADTILRDLFKERNGITMNALRESFADREKQVTDQDRSRALEAACAVGENIERGPMVSFRRAFAQHAEDLAGSLGITDAAAKTLMKEEFNAAERTDFYEWGKGLEQRFYRPQVEAEQRRREHGSDDRDADRGQTASRRDPGRADYRNHSNHDERSRDQDDRQEASRRDYGRSDGGRRYRTGPSGP